MIKTSTGIMPQQGEIAHEASDAGGGGTTSTSTAHPSTESTISPKKRTSHALRAVILKGRGNPARHTAGAVSEELENGLSFEVFVGRVRMLCCSAKGMTCLDCQERKKKISESDKRAGGVVKRPKEEGSFLPPPTPVDPLGVLELACLDSTTTETLRLRALVDDVYGEKLERERGEWKDRMALGAFSATTIPDESDSLDRVVADKVRICVTDSSSSSGGSTPKSSFLDLPTNDTALHQLFDENGSSTFHRVLANAVLGRLNPSKEKDLVCLLALFRGPDMDILLELLRTVGLCDHLDQVREILRALLSLHDTKDMAAKERAFLRGRGLDF